MVGKLSDDRIMSGSRIPVLYCWEHGDGHPYSTPNDELRRSIAAKHGELERGGIGEPGEIGNLLEPALVRSVADITGIPYPDTNPPLMEHPNGLFETSLDGLSVCDEPVTVFASDLVEIDGGDPSITLTGRIPIECKVTSDYRRDEIPLFRGPIQLQAQMMAAGADFGIIITLYRGIERQVRIYRADSDIQHRIEALCDDFNSRVESEVFFKPVSVDDAAHTYHSAEGAVDLPNLAEKVERLEMLRRDLKETQDEIDSLQTAIMNEMEDAETATCGGYLVRWPVRHYKAQPERVTPAKDARSVRLKSLQIRRF